MTRINSVIFVVLAFTAAASGQQAPIGYDDTPMQPNGKWRVHDGTRPYPSIVTVPPPTDAPVPAPSDAIVLLGKGDDLSAWQMSDGSAATWAMKGGVLQTGKGMLRTKQQFTDLQVHVEFATPSDVKGDSQGRGNSGVFLLGHFEIQVLDSYRNITYPDGQAASMYGQYPPLVNAARAPGQWQVYDIIFAAPRFSGDKLEKPALVTVVHNGVVVHHGTSFWGPTRHKSVLPYTPEMARGPLALQDHGNPVRYRNIWVREIKDYDSR